jgi:hypothetical protein
MLNPCKRRVHLIRSYLRDRIEISDKNAEKRAIRTFLARVDRLLDSENPLSIELTVCPCEEDPLAVLIFASMPGIGRITWMPTLVIAGSEKLADIVRETTPRGPIPKYHPEPVSLPRNDDASARKRVFPPIPETRLIPGRSI